jgi:hypothetical protein
LFHIHYILSLWLKKLLDVTNAWTIFFTSKKIDPTYNMMWANNLVVFINYVRKLMQYWNHGSTPTLRGIMTRCLFFSAFLIVFGCVLKEHFPWKKHQTSVFSVLSNYFDVLISKNKSEKKYFDTFSNKKNTFKKRFISQYQTHNECKCKTLEYYSQTKKKINIYWVLIKSIRSHA